MTSKQFITGRMLKGIEAILLSECTEKERFECRRKLVEIMQACDGNGPEGNALATAAYRLLLETD